VRDFVGQKLYVGGEVAMPGVIPLKGRLTVLQAILSAGGFKETAHEGNVIVISRGPNDTSVARNVDLRDVITGKVAGEDVFAKPFDVIYVPKTLIAEVDKFVDQYIRKAIPVDLSAGFNYGIFKNKVPLR
jgi:protein involved in polysaccharide export with SLBB domain